MRKSLLFVFCLVIGMTLVASLSCKKASDAAGKKLAEKMVQTASGGKVKADLGAAGGVDISELPELLRYPGAKAIGKWSMSDDKSKGTSYMMETTDPVATVTSYYKTKLTGWKSSMAMETENGTVLGYASADEKQSAVITVAADDSKKKTSITIIYGLKQ